MDTRIINRTLTTLFATFGAAVSIAGAGPTVVIDPVSTPGAERLAVGIEVRAFCLRVVAEATLGTLEVNAPRGCAVCRQVGP
jgi:hypothetical protein